MKKGFTLAEVLVTLGIIGVVAALTTPALIQNVGNAKVGPKLMKAKATWENATELMLNEENSNTVIGVSRQVDDLLDKLSNYMKISKTDCYDVKYYARHSSNMYLRSSQNNCYSSDDGMTFWVNGHQAPMAPVDEFHTYSLTSSTPKHKLLIGAVDIDINGNQQPNSLGRDVFSFLLMNDGSLVPYGGTKSKEIVGSYWNSQHHDCDEYGVSTGRECAGSIFDNGMKIIYE